jgi:hypothetical protein
MVGNTCEYSNDNYKYHREEGSARAPYVARMFLVSERSMAGVTTVSSKEDGVDDLNETQLNTKALVRPHIRRTC